MVLDELDEHPLQIPYGSLGFGPSGPGQVDGLHQLAEYVQLELQRCRIAHPHRPGSLVAGKPVELQLREAPLAGHPVHNLQLVGVAGGGP